MSNVPELRVKQCLMCWISAHDSCVHGTTDPKATKVPGKPKPVYHCECGAGGHK